MAQKTSGEIEKDFMDGLEAASGRPLSAWLKTIDGFGTKKRNDIVAKLKSEHGFGHMHASLLAGLHANGGKPVYASTDALLDAHLEKAPDMRSLYEAFLEFVGRNFPASSVLPKKTYVSILENREFAAINIKAKELRIGLDLGDRPFDETVGRSKLTGPMPRISHMVVLTGPGQLDDDLVKLLAESHARCH